MKKGALGHKPLYFQVKLPNIQKISFLKPSPLLVCILFHFSLFTISLHHSMTFEPPAQHFYVQFRVELLPVLQRTYLSSIRYLSIFDTR